MIPQTKARFLDKSSPPNILTLVALAGLAALAMNIFLPSLHGMAAYFEADYGLMQLSVSLYLGVNAVLQILLGPITDRYGRRPVMLCALVLFLLATLGTLWAPTVEIFLVFRGLQAVVVAGIVLSRAVVRDMVPDEEAASMIGYVTMGMAVVPMIGPAIGGWLDEMFGWHASFMLLFVFGVFVALLTWFDMGETAQSGSTSFEEQLKQYPELLKSHRFWGYCAAAAFASGAFFAYLGGAPFVGSEVFDLSPSVLGYYFGTPAVGYALGNFLSGRYSRQLGINRMVFWGTVVTSLGLVCLIVVYMLWSKHPVVFFGFLVTVGLGNGLVMPNAAAGMLSVRPRLAGSASGLGGAIMIGGGAVLSAFAGWMLTPGSGPMPLIAIMLATSLASVVSILYVIWRERVVDNP